MNKVNLTLLAAGLVLAMAFTFSCSDNDSGDSNDCSRVISLVDSQSECGSACIAQYGSMTSGSSWNSKSRECKCSLRCSDLR